MKIEIEVNKENFEWFFSAIENEIIALESIIEEDPTYESFYNDRINFLKGVFDTIKSHHETFSRFSKPKK